jgi:hypothetical protein
MRIRWKQKSCVRGAVASIARNVKRTCRSSQGEIICWKLVLSNNGMLEILTRGNIQEIQFEGKS